MIEDMELATVVRRALEESVTPAGRGSPAAIMALAAQEAARRRRVRCWRRGAGLAAAVLAAILLLPRWLDINGIWLAVTAAESLTLLVTVSLLAAKRRKHHY